MIRSNSKLVTKILVECGFKLQEQAIVIIFIQFVTAEDWEESDTWIPGEKQDYFTTICLGSVTTIWRLPLNSVTTPVTQILFPKYILDGSAVNLA